MSQIDKVVKNSNIIFNYVFVIINHTILAKKDMQEVNPKYVH